MNTPKENDPFYQVVGVLSIVSCAYSAFLAWASVQIGAWCLMCISMYAANAIMLWASLRGLKETEGSLTDGLGAALGSRTLVTVAVVALLSIGVGMSSYSEERSKSAEAAPRTGPLTGATLANFYALPEGTVTLDGDEPVLGDPDAPYLVVEFADFGCPHCASASKDLKALVQQNPDVQVRFRVFPLANECNPGIDQGFGPDRCTAAAAAECARQQGKAWEFQSLVFANQRYLGPSDMLFQAGQVGLDMDAFQACVTDPATMDQVVADARAGLEAHVEGTPTMFLKGTHGDQYVRLTQGVAGLERIVESHRLGVVLPDPRPAAHAPH